MFPNLSKYKNSAKVLIPYYSFNIWLNLWCDKLEMKKIARVTIDPFSILNYIWCCELLRAFHVNKSCALICHFVEHIHFIGFGNTKNTEQPSKHVLNNTILSILLAAPLSHVMIFPFVFFSFFFSIWTSIWRSDKYGAKKITCT